MTLTELSEVTGIIYAPPVARNIGEKLLHDIETYLEHEKLVICETINNLAFYLLPQRSLRASKQIITVLFITGLDDLRDVVDFHDLLLKYSVINVLFDDYEGIINIANTLDPCFTYFIQNIRKDTTPLAEQFKYLRETF